MLVLDGYDPAYGEVIVSDRRALCARGVSVVYDGVAVLDRVSVDLIPGEPPIGVIGESGAGKTSLVEVLAGWAAPSSGVVAYGDLDPHHPPRRYRKTVRAGVRGVREEQDPVGAQRFTGAQAMDRAMKLARQTGRGPVGDAAEMCELVGFDPSDLGRLLREMSLGEQQRLTMARALVTDPDILLLDEPATALDPEATAEVMDAVMGFCRDSGAAVLVVSHDLELISRVAGTVITLHEGRETARAPLNAAEAVARPRP